MKKKLLLVSLALALFMCLFAMGVSAAGFESDYDVAVTTYGNGPDWANVEDKESTAVIKLANDSFVRVPVCYIFKANANLRFENNGSNFDFGWISEQLDETVTLDSLVAIEVPNGTTSFSGSISSTTFKSLNELVIPTTVTGLPQKFLRDNVVIERLFIKQTKDSEGNVVGITEIPDYFADMQGSNVSALEYFKLELNYVTRVGANAFNKAAIREITLEGPITKSGSFSSCPYLTTVNLNNTGNVISLDGKAFAYSPNLTSVTLNGFNLSNYLFEDVKGLAGGLRVVATNVQTLGEMPFKNATNLEYVEISGPLTSFGSSTFSGCHNLETVIVNNTGSTVATASGSFCELKDIKNVKMDGVAIGYRMFYKVTTLESVALTNIGTVIGKEAFRGSNITSITIPAGFTLISQHAFADCKSLTTVTFAGDAGENAEIGYASFENCSALETMNIPEGVTTLGDCPFKNAGLKYVSLPSTLTTAKGINHFLGCKLISVTGLENTKLTSIPEAMFRGASNWQPDVVRIPDTVESIGKQGFADCGATVFILGTRVQTIGSEAFVNCARVQKVYIPDTVTSISSNAFNNNKTGNILFFIVSSDADYIATIKTGTLATTNEAVTYKTYKLSTDSYAKGRYVIYGCNKCELFYNNEHTPDAEKSNACVVLCSVCGKTDVNHNENAELLVTIVYTDYTVAGVKTTACKNQGCTHCVTEEAPVLFECLGFSAPENGVFAITLGYRVNRNAIDEYADLAKVTVDYGIFVVAKNKLGSNDVMDADGNFASGVIGTSMMARKFSYYDIKVVGIETDAHKSAEMAMGTYVIVTDEDGTEITYIQESESTEEGAKYSFVSYNSVVNA